MRLLTVFYLTLNYPISELILLKIQRFRRVLWV